MSDYDAREDPRTIPEMKQDDVAQGRVDEGTITRAVKHDDGWWDIGYDADSGGSMGLGITTARNPHGIEPKEGQHIRVYGRFGSSYHGIDINGREVFYKTPLEREAERARSLADHDRKKREEFERGHEEQDARLAALPEGFQERIHRRRRNNPTFRMDFEDYEVFCCRQAVAFAERAKTAAALNECQDEIEAFWGDETKWRERYPKWERTPESPPVRWLYWWYSLGYERQRTLMPGMDDGHSGNTFGAATYLASVWIEAPDKVAEPYGALAPLVGSANYGDVGPDEKAAVEA